ncbi:MAG: FtsX-like permease family protein [Candidatus Aminicenantes bacterium]
MWFYIKLAWRNVFRNKRRTVIASTAIGIGLASLIFVDGLIIGMKDSMIRSATGSFLGEAQIHAEDYRQTREVEKTIHQPGEVQGELQQAREVENFTPRVMSYAMITSAANVRSVQMVGVEPERESGVSKIDDAVQEGTFFGEDNPRDVLIGSELAEILEVSLGDRVVITVSQAESGDLSQEMFRISGTFHFNAQEMDKGMIFVRLGKAQEMLNLGDGIHEIAVQFHNIQDSMDPELPFWERFSRRGNEAASWTELLPQLKAVFEMTAISRWVMFVLIASVVVFGIINTLFMSLYERLFEFGVLRAVGTRSGGVLRLMILEAGALGIISAGIGIVLGLIVTAVLAHTGIDYRGIEFAGSTIHELIYPVLNVHQFIFYPLGVIAFTALVGVYPAFTAARMSITEAMRRSL